MISYLKHNEIQRDLWNECIAGACFETPYACSWYLDLAAQRWDALVMDEYRAVMPLVWKRKFLVPYIYQPLNTQQLGIFSAEQPDQEMIRLFLDRIPGRFLWLDMCLNASNGMIRELRQVETRSNYELRLEGSYEQLSAKYHTNTKRNLKKAGQGGIRTGSATVEELLYLKASAEHTGPGSPRYRRLRSILSGVTGQNKGSIRAAWKDEVLCAAVFWLYSRTRNVYLLSVSSEEGREQRAMFRLVDEHIRAHAGSGRIIDFEGSSIPSIARFFQGFGGIRTEYYRFCRAHPVLKWIMRK